MNSLVVIIFLLMLICFFVYASYSIRAGIYLRSFCRKKTKEKVVALTFDDGPDVDHTLKVLDILKEKQIKACFFCIGSKVEGNEWIIRRIVEEGHLIGNHTFTHTGFFPCYSLRKMKEDLLRCDKVLTNASNQPVKLFRPPFGVTNPTIAKAVKELGYTSIGWNIRTLDTMKVSVEKVVRRVKRTLSPGSVILLHDRMPHIDKTLSDILELLEKENYRILRIDELIKK